MLVVQRRVAYGVIQTMADNGLPHDDGGDGAMAVVGDADRGDVRICGGVR